MSFREGRLLETKTDVAVSFGVKDFFVCRCCCCCCCRHGRGIFLLGNRFWAKRRRWFPFLPLKRSCWLVRRGK